MTQTSPNVNFYILSDSDPQRRLYFIYRLVEKSHSQGLTTLIITADENQQKQLDKLIWAADPTSFLAHECVGDSTSIPTLSTPLPPIVLSTDASKVPPTLQADVAIDLSYDATTLNYPKIMLVANQHPDILPNARMKYQAYANQGIKPNVYKIGETQSQT